ncbi:MAG: DUF4296 domain-containing protein [Bacteroidales bacterium]|nr:DUF4296 domain-containing protein [Bacteroidales bacterium]MBQ7213615.1 DUF4296 domain-containing protein [Bacteroidales bacterium]
MYPLHKFCERIICLLLAGLLATACRHEPPAMIPLDDFEDLVTEIHWANGFFQSKSTGNVYWDDTMQYNVYLMHKHGYTEAQFDSTLNFLCHHPKKFNKIYTRIVNKFNAMQEAILREPDPPELLHSTGLGYMASPDSMHGSFYLTIDLRDTGLYRISADILLYPQDQSFLPHMSFWFAYGDSLQPAREYLTPAERWPLRPNGRLTHYSFERRLSRTPAQLQGYFVGHVRDLRPDTVWFKAVEIQNAELIFQRDTMRTTSD